MFLVFIRSEHHQGQVDPQNGAELFKALKLSQSVACKMALTAFSCVFLS